MRKVLYVLGQLDDQDVEWLLRVGSRELYAPGHVLIHEGQPVAFLYVVLEGLLAVFTVNTGSEMLMRLPVGEIVGEMSFVDERPPSATVKTIEPTVVLSIPRDALSKHLAEDDAFATRFYRAIALFISDRLRSNIHRISYGINHPIDEDLEQEDELDLNVLDSVYLAGARFDRIVKRLLNAG